MTNEHFARTETDHMYESEPLNFAIHLARQAAVVVKEELTNNLDVEWKEDNTPVTNIDRKVNSLAISLLSQHFPKDRLLGEEESLAPQDASEKTWVLDPIDGTQALEVGLPTYTVCIARVDANGQPELAVIINPTTNELFTVQRGEPARLNGHELRVSDRTTLQSSYVYMSSRMPKAVASVGTIFDKLTDAGAKVFNTRSVAFGCLMVAMGKCVGSFSGVSTPFEIASVKLLVENAGGKVTDLDGNTDFRCDGEINGFIVSNGHVHDQLLALIARQ